MDNNLGGNVMIGFYWLNRLRGTYSYFSKVNGVLLGLLFWWAINPLVGSLVAIGYILGESMGWGQWIGQQCGSPLECGDEGEKNGIKWIASKFVDCGTERYNKIALVIRGFYWWFPTLAPLFFVMDFSVVALSIITLSFGFQISLDWASGTGKPKWDNAEYIYGGIQDVVFLFIFINL